jgi:hypothetical protein
LQWGRDVTGTSLLRNLSIRRRPVGIGDGTANVEFLTQAFAAIIRQKHFAIRKALRLVTARVTVLLLYISNGIGNP